MNELADVQRYLLNGCAVFLSVTIFFCLLRAALGPRFTDRIIAASMISTKVILLIAITAKIVGQDYLIGQYYVVDICLIYAIISFLSIVVLARSVLEHKEEDKE